ncbi:hypothetical protein CsSME_00024811 [Camellia sinensis var. sinensis]
MAGKDKSVVLWSIHDHVLTLTSDPSTKPTGSDGSIIKTTENISIGPHGIFQGHEDTVEDVQFCPSSIGDDSCLILWDHTMLIFTVLIGIPMMKTL